MPAWPKSFITFGASVLTARTALLMRRRDRGSAAQRKAFAAIVGRMATTSYWRQAGIEAGMTYDLFRTRVAPRGYEAVAPGIERMRRGESDVLWPGPCRLFVSTSGTNTGTERLLPVPVEMLHHYRNGCRAALLYYTARAGHAGVFRGRHLFLTGPTSLKPLADGSAPNTFAGEWPAVALLDMPPWVDQRLFEPGVEIGNIGEWQAKMDATITRTMVQDITLIAGMPSWVLGFAEQVRSKCAAEGRPIEQLESLWPNLECLVHGGMSLAPYQTELRALVGPKTKFHEVYAAAEGIFAAQDTTPNAGLRVMTDLGIFFEFVPLTEFDEGRPEACGAKAVPLADVKAGIDYVVLLTTPAGLARYIIGDVVRFASVEPPRLNCVGRVPLLLSAFGERVLEKDVTEALLTVCGRHRWTIVNFHVAPLFGNNLTGQARGRHEWWVELRPGTVETPTGPQMAVELDLELQRLHREYAARRGSGRIEPPTVRLVMPGVFRHWSRFHKKVGGHNKIARCRSDRLMADELAQITKFARD